MNTQNNRVEVVIIILFIPFKIPNLINIYQDIRKLGYLGERIASLCTMYYNNKFTLSS